MNDTVIFRGSNQNGENGADQQLEPDLLDQQPVINLPGEVAQARQDVPDLNPIMPMEELAEQQELTRSEANNVNRVLRPPMDLEDSAEILEELKQNLVRWKSSKRRSASFWAFYEAQTDPHKVALAKSSKREALRCFVCSKAGRSVGQYNYDHSSGTSGLRNHVQQKHKTLLEQLAEEDKSKLPGSSARGNRAQSIKRRKSDRSSASDVRKHLVPIGTKDAVTVTTNFIEDQILCHAKAFEPLSAVENPWKLRQWLRLNNNVKVPARWEMRQKFIPAMVEKTKNSYVIPYLEQALVGSLTYDLWMTHGTCDEFAVMFHWIYVGPNLTPGAGAGEEVVCRMMKVCLGLVKIDGRSTGANVATSLVDLLDQYPTCNLREKIVADVSDGGSNLKVLRNVVKDLILPSLVPNMKSRFVGKCFGHEFSAALRQALDDTKVTKDIPNSDINLDALYRRVRPSTTWPKKSTIGKAVWDKTAIDLGIANRLPAAPVSTRMASKLTYYSHLLECKPVVTAVYHNHPSEQLRKRNPSPEDWDVITAVVECTDDAVKLCFKNQATGYWLLVDAVASCLELGIKMKELHKKYTEDVRNYTAASWVGQLAWLRANILRVLFSRIDETLDFLHPDPDPDSWHNMFALMLDHRHKGLRLVKKYKDFLSHEERKAFVQRWTNRLLDFLTDIALTQTNSARKRRTPPEDKEHEEPILGSSGSDLISVDESVEDAGAEARSAAEAEYRRIRNFGPASPGYPHGVTDPLQWWFQVRMIFPIGWIAILLLFCIPGSQIDVERLFSVAGYLTANRRANMGTEMLNALVYINQNWPNDALADLRSELSELVPDELELLHIEEKENVDLGDDEFIQMLDEAFQAVDNM